jgi:hypothetical protein
MKMKLRFDRRPLLARYLQDFNHDYLETGPDRRRTGQTLLYVAAGCFLTAGIIAAIGILGM